MIRFGVNLPNHPGGDACRDGVGGMSLVTTDPAPMMAPSPICTPGTTVTLEPIQTFFPVTMGAG